MNMETQENLVAHLLAGGGMVRAIPDLVMSPKIESMHTENAHNSAAIGWAALAAGVFAWDMLAPRTLSEGVDDALERNKTLTYAAVGTVAAHLLNLLPESVDPIHQFGKRARSRLHH
jgi:hypothetical protein